MIYKKIEPEISWTNLFRLFRENHIKSNSDKYHLVTSRNLLQFNIEGHICNSTEVKLVGVKIDSQLLLDFHVSTFWKKACLLVSLLLTLNIFHISAILSRVCLSLSKNVGHIG